MPIIEFETIEDRGAGLVAVFRKTVPAEHPTFALNEESLRNRITNVEAGKSHPDRDASVERVALTEMLRRKGK